MKKFGEFFVYAAILLILAIGGCGFDLPVDADGGAAVDPTLSPPPAGRVWVKIPLPDETERTLTGAGNLAYIDYYEVFFLRRAATDVQEYLFSGSAGKDEQLIVSVAPDVTYEVLLLSGDQKTKTLLASAYDPAVTIVSGQVNQVNLTLTYVVSDPVTSGTSSFKFTYTDGTTFDGVAAAGSEVATVTVETTSKGTGYLVNDLLMIDLNASSTEDLGTIYVKVTSISTGGAVETVDLVQGGRWKTAPTGSDVISTAITGVGSGAKFDISFATPIDIPPGAPWLTYLPNDATGFQKRTNPLKFEITTEGLTPLINAGGPVGPGAANFKLSKARLQLVPLNDGVKYNYGDFPMVQDISTYSAPFVVSTLSGTSTGIILTYIFNKDALPYLFSYSTYGILYYVVDYYPFGDKATKWSIRNGIDTKEADRGEATRGSGVIVKIGNPGVFVSKVPVQVGTP